MLCVFPLCRYLSCGVVSLSFGWVWLWPVVGVWPAVGVVDGVCPVGFVVGDGAGFAAVGAGGAGGL